MALEEVDMGRVKVVPGLIFEPVGTIRYIAGYLDLNMDLRSTKNIHTNLNIIKTEIMQLQETIVHIERNPRSIPQEENIEEGSGSIPIITAPTKHA